MGRALYIMVVKTELCNYSGFRIYPGHGKKFIRADQKMFTFINGKTAACRLMKRRNLTTKWTVQYRRINKKGTQEEESKRRRSTKKSTTTRAVAGMNAELMQKRDVARSAAAKKTDKQRDIALKEIKSRKGAAKKVGKK